MARTIKYSFISLFFALSSVQPIVAQSETDGQKVFIILPPKNKLETGRNYPVKIDISGETVEAKLKVPGAPPPNSPPDTPNPPKKDAPDVEPPKSGRGSDMSPSENVSRIDWTMIALAAIAPLMLILISALIYFKIIRPRKQLQPYHTALKHLNQKEYDAALRLLTQTESKLTDRLRRDARFFIAFANFQLNNSKEAEYLLKTLYREDSDDSNSAYLLAYILVKENRYKEAEPVLERMEAKRQLNAYHARKLLGIVKFHQALTAVREGRFDAAGELFEKVQALGDFTGQIPEDLRNRQIVLGTKALFDKDLPEARKQFESLQRAAPSASEKQRNSLQAAANIGLALAKWIEDAPDSGSAIEDLCLEAVKLLDPDSPITLPWPSDAKGKDIVEKLNELDNETEQSNENKEYKQFLRDIHFLRGMTVLRSWGKMDGEAAHKAIDEHYESSLARFACSLALDDEFSDVIMVVGLLKYYLHKPGPERSQGVDLLQQAQKFGMRDPDAMEIINNRERIEKANADTVDKYLQVLDKYLHDDTVRKEVRIALMERLAKYKKVQNWEKRPDLSQARSVEPTLAEVRNRSDLLRERIEQIYSSRGGEDADVIKKRSDAIALNGQKLYEQSKEIEKEEIELLAEAGNRLFQD